MVWRPGDYVGLMDRQLVSFECSPALAEKAKALFEPATKVRVIEGAQADFWAVITRTEPFLEAQSKSGEMSDRMASMLRRLEAHFRSNYHCCYRGKNRLGGHDADCILEETATLLRELP